MKTPTKIPTIIGLLLIFALVGSIIALERIFRSPSGAAGSQEPTNVHITNVSDSSFTVSWLTDVATSGTLLTKTTGISNHVYYDERDLTGKLGTYTTHYIMVRDASPSTDYSLIPLSNGKEYFSDGKPWSIHTPITLSPQSGGLEPAYGTIQQTNEQPMGGALVYLTIDGGQELSALTKASGLWLIPLNQIRKNDLTDYLPTSNRMTENILVQANGLQTTAITDTLNDSPVPEMTLGKIYDFRHQQAKTSESNTLASNQLPTNGTVLGDTTNRSYTVSLVSPAQGAGLSATLPLIQGTGIPGTYIGISLGITQVMTGSTKVDPNGQWSFTPPKTLAPGKQSVTISTVDSKNQPVAITHTFEIFKSGTQVLGDATASATLTPESSPTDTITESPTPVSVPESTLSGQPPPSTGDEFPTIISLILGIVLLSGGATIAALK